MRHFRIADGRTVTLPQGLQPGPGQTNMRFEPGSYCTLEDDHGPFERFIANRIRVGDMVPVAAIPDGAEGGQSVAGPGTPIASDAKLADPFNPSQHGPRLPTVHHTMTTDTPVKPAKG
jgi:hypothetical protein